MIKNTMLLLISFFIFLPNVQADTLHFATENEDSFPWVMKDKTGVDIFLIKKALANLGHTLELTQVPWKRALHELDLNKIDGCFTASYKDKRAKLGHYPTVDGADHDASKRLHSASYSLYVLKDSSLGWDGSKFTSASVKIGAPMGYSILDLLKEHKVAIHEAKKTEQLMLMLKAARLDGVATLTTQGDLVLAQNPELAGLIKKVAIPLVEKPYYLLFSKKLFSENNALALQIWDEIEKVRNSDEYQQEYEKALK